jgi:hypothetical protein
MIFHASIPADDPERVARVLGELWQRDYFPFVLEGTFVIFANDGLGTQLEVAPRREEIIPAPEHLDLQSNSAPRPTTPYTSTLIRRLPSNKSGLLPIGRAGWHASATVEAPSR